MIKKYWVYYLFAFSVMFFVYVKLTHKQIVPEATLEVKAVKQLNGWGYEIYRNGKVFISQESIPSLEGNKPFKTEKDALIVGNYVALKMKTKKGLPTISPKEIDSLGIAK